MIDIYIVFRYSLVAYPDLSKEGKMRTRSLMIPWISAAIALLVTGVAWYLTKESLEKFDETRFRNLSSQLEHEISFRMQTYLNTLVQTKSMFQVTHNVDRVEFKNYVQSLEIMNNYPGIQGVGFAQRVSLSHLQNHTREIQGQGFKNYAIWPKENKKEYFPIIYLEPFDWRNQRAFGYDMSADAVRESAMMRARDTGQPVASNKVRLVQETGRDDQAGFLIYVPVYKRGALIQTIEQRRNSLVGFVYSPFRAGDLFSNIFEKSPKHHPIDFEILIGVDEGDGVLIYTKIAEGKKSSNYFDRASLKTTFSLDIAGQSWTVKATPAPIFYQASSRLVPRAIALLGLACSVLLFWIVRRHDRFTAADRERAFQMETINRVGKILSGELDLQRLVQAVTDAGRDLSKAEFGAFFYNVVNQKGEAYTLYTISGVPRDMFSRFPMPRNTAVFEPTFKGEGTVRSDDITKDARYGLNPPYKGMPSGHLPVRSYLAVPVISRTSEVIGGLFYGHSRPAVFAEREEKLVEGIAAQAAIAVDNARLFQKNKEAIAIRDEFLSIASHELKTPITSLKLLMQMTRRTVEPDKGKLPTPEKLAKVFDIATSQINRLSALIEDLLDVSRIQSGKLVYNFEETELTTLVREMVERFCEQLKVANCDLSTDIVGPVYVRCDRFRFEQVILNLLSNAAKYGAGKPIEVGLKSDGHVAKFYVRDHGIGIAPQNVDAIFERFVRAVPSTNISGLGLGLYISREIVNAHNGKIRVESQEGSGSNFVVEIPVVARKPKGFQPSAAAIL